VADARGVCEGRRVMTKRIAILIAGTLALAACGAEDPAGGGSSANAPTPAAMLEKAITATTNQKSAAFELTASVEGASDDPEVKPFLEKPLKLDVSGKASPKAVDIAGKASVRGTSYQLAIRADEQKSFIQFMNTWYGPDDGITGTTEGSSTDPAELKQALLALRKYGNDVLKGKVAEGPELDGQKTWEFNGTLNPDGIVKVAKAEGQPLTADDQTGLRAIAPLIKIKFATGQQDGLLREASFDFKLNANQLKLLNQAGDSEIPLKELAVKLTVKLSDYGTAVTIEEPADPQPTKALGGALLGAFFSITG
jgi:hypothetical protein